MPKCPKCEALYGIDDDFCPECGERLKGKLIGKGYLKYFIAGGVILILLSTFFMFSFSSIQPMRISPEISHRPEYGTSPSEPNIIAVKVGICGPGDVVSSWGTSGSSYITRCKEVCNQQNLKSYSAKVRCNYGIQECACIEK